MASRLMLVEGEVQRSKEGVIHLMASRIVDRTEMLDTLGHGDPVCPAPAHADGVAHPQPPRGHAQRHGHPRNVRILPRSRDFH
jgi:error-prone DNA polymerase